MNYTVNFDYKQASDKTERDRIEEGEFLKAELDEIFRNKISTPDDIYIIYDKLERYKLCTGNDYKITFEENTIV